MSKQPQNEFDDLTERHRRADRCANLAKQFYASYSRETMHEMQRIMGLTASFHHWSESDKVMMIRALRDVLDNAADPIDAAKAERAHRDSICMTAPDWRKVQSYVGNGGEFVAPPFAISGSFDLGRKGKEALTADSEQKIQHGITLGIGFMLQVFKQTDIKVHPDAMKNFIKNYQVTTEGVPGDIASTIYRVKERTQQ